MSLKVQEEMFLTKKTRITLAVFFLTNVVHFFHKKIGKCLDFFFLVKIKFKKNFVDS